MAQKQAIFIVLDIGSSMYDKSHSSKAKIETCIECIELMIQQKMFNAKTHELGMIFFGSDDAEDGNTVYVREIGKPDLEFVRNVHQIKDFEPPKKAGGDIFDALDKAIATLDAYVLKKKYEKKIFLMTNGSGDTNYSQNDILKLYRSASTANVKLNVICLDFLKTYNPETEETELKEDPNQSRIQNKNQNLLLQLKQNLNDNLLIFPSELAINLYRKFRTKITPSRVSWRGELQITTYLSLEICFYKKTLKQAPPPLKTYSKVAPFNKMEGINAIIRDPIYYLQEDPNMNPIDLEQVVKGYQYGKQIVPLSKIHLEQMDLKAEKGMKLLGFVDSHKIPRNSFLGGVDMVVPCQGIRDQKTFAALVNAMCSLKKYAVVRLVERQTKSNPKLCVLIPHKSKEHECFYLTELPTSESIRDFQFNSLKKATPQQNQAVSDLIDSMDLTNQIDQGGDVYEAVETKNIFNPTRQYVYQAVLARALDETCPIPDLDPVICDYLYPEREILKNANTQTENLKKAFNFKVNEIKKFEGQKAFWKNLVQEQEQQSKVTIIQQVSEAASHSQVETEEALDYAKCDGKKFAFDKDQEIIRQISISNVVEDFQKMISEKSEDLVEEAVEQMKALIIRFVKESFQGNFYQKATESLSELRKACISEDETTAFNNFLTEIKSLFSNDYIHKDYWNLVIKNGITLISNLENKQSTFSIKDAQQFLVEEEKQVLQTMRKENKDIEDEFLDEIE